MNGLITPAAFADRIDDVRIADVRWYLGEPNKGHEEYHAGHIPGAVFVSLEDHLSAPAGPGRHPLPSRDEFAATMGRLGFGDDDFIVAYDDRGGAVAARLWWMLRDIGHDAVAILDGGLPGWIASGGSLSTGHPSPTSTAMTVRASSTRSIDRAALSERIGSVKLLDVRAPERFRGDDEPIDPVGGHIPTALNSPITDNLDDLGAFLGVDELRARYSGLEGEEVVVYCGSGVTACHSILAMKLAGLPEPILYPGSWSDWSTAGMPVATGP